MKKLFTILTAVLVTATLWAQSPESINDYCIPSAFCTYGDGFSDFAFAGIENYDSGCSPNGYGDFTDMEATVEIGYTYTATFASRYSGQRVSMWIDFNQDDVFSDTERVLTDFIITQGNVLKNVDIVIPGSGMPGNTTMRIGAGWNTSSAADPCAALEYGEWEDYSVEVTGSTINLNAGVVSIDIDPIMPSGNIIPLATVKNFGAETASFPVTMTVEATGYSSTIQVTDLGPNDEIQVVFDTWNAPLGAYDVEFCTELSGDEFVDNDCMTANISAIDYDAGIEAITIGSVIPTGYMIPTATIKNYGFETISFPVTMTIEEANYTSTVQVTNLTAGEEILLQFSTWSNSLGQYTVEVCTGLSNDENLENDCSEKLVTVSENPRQKVIMEFFTDAGAAFCSQASAGLEELHQDFPANTAVIAWHNSDEFEIPTGIGRKIWYDVLANPTVWFDGVTNVLGSSPTVYNTYLTKYESRIAAPTNFTIDMEISTGDNDDYNVETTIEVITGINTENLALYVVLTESDLETPIDENQLWVARDVYPGDMGLPVDFSTQTTQSFNTVITLDEEYVIENCEVVVFLQNMDTKEICQGTSLMMTDIVGIDQINATGLKIYPNPATNFVTISSVNKIQSLTVYNIVGQVVTIASVESDLYRLNTSNYKDGVYFLQLETAEGRISEKFIIE